MAEIAYISREFNKSSLAIIAQARIICAEYAAAGYSLTLRQLYYQFVARGYIPNRDTEYKRLGSIINDARMAGLLDWDYIVDRTRTMRSLPHWGTASDEGPDAANFFVRSVMPQFRTSKWSTQPTRIEVWIEKDALIDVIARPANALDIPYFACRGYNSQSNAWQAARRIENYYDEGAEQVIILHLGDHDPSGIDMSRDIEERFRIFLEGDGYASADPVFSLRRIALNMDQVRQYNPPPNPAKLTDSRVANYLEHYGDTSWELDALDPPTIDALIQAEVRNIREPVLWDEAVARESEGKEILAEVATRWSDVVRFLRNGHSDE